MKQFKKNRIAMSVSMLVASSAVGMAYAPVASAQEGVVEEVVVTGIKGSLQRAQAVKMDSSSVVEAISAEDIGKLPDSSIAESLARLPGLAGERRGGRTSGLSVRGFREDFVGTTMNGRELIGIGDNRGVEYDLYPSEIMSGATVFKSPDASLSMMGIGGTVDLKTARPLDAKPTLTFNGSYEMNDLESKNPDFDDTGHRLALSYVDQFADGKVGVALAVASTESPSQAEFFSVWGYTTGEITSGPNAGAYVPDGIDISSRSRLLERDTFSGVLQFAPTDSLTATLDYLYIDFSDTGISRGFIEDLPNASDGSGVISAENGVVTSSAENGVVTSATTSGFRSVIRTDPLEKTGELTTYGVNLELFMNETWSLKLDASHAESDKNETRAESYAGVGRPLTGFQGDATIRTWTATGNGLMFSNNSTDFSDYSTMKLAGPQSWGGSLAAFGDEEGDPLFPQAGFPNVGFAQAQDGFLNAALFDEELDAIRLEAVGELDQGFIKSVNFGVRYSEHSKSKNNTGAFLTSETWPSDALIPEEFRSGTADLTWTGLDEVVAYDGLGAIKSGFYTQWDAAELEPDRLGDTYTVDEEVWQAFVKVDFNAAVGDVNVFGNVGFQEVWSDQSGTGFFNVRIDENLLTTYDLITDGADYTNFLPSLNLNFDLGAGHMVRFTASKVISRARISELGPGSYVKFANNIDDVRGTTAEEGPWTSATGNTQLRPYEADQFDLSYEWYFSDIGYVSVTYFYKDLVNWIRTSTRERDYTEFYIPGFHQGYPEPTDTDPNPPPEAPATFLGVDTFREDGLTGEVDGIEFQFNLPVGEFIEALDGLGFVWSSSFTDGDLDDGSRIPGLSEEVYSATVFYERQGFEIRLSATKRDDFLSEDRGGSNSLTEVTRSGSELLDAQISYDFMDTGIQYLEGLRVSLQAQNLGDEDDTSTGVAGLVTRNESYGRNFLLSFNYSFW